MRIDLNELEDWANAIECRDDLDFENDGLKELVHAMANPLLLGVLSLEKVRDYRESLRSSSPVR
ncbi:hypothetical protein BH10ACI2_BH10ACI2_16600 [soil metagenome]